MKILIFGSTGQLGASIVSHATQLGHDVICANRDHVSHPERCFEQPLDWVINAAAYTHVDQAETDQDTAGAVNTHFPGRLGRLCADHDIPIVHFSTDYVFDGTNPAPYVETDPPSPINFYGRSKLEGEIALQETSAPHLIFRTSWVVSSKRQNFLKTMVRLMQDRAILSIVNDQVGAPNHTQDLAHATLSAINGYNRSKTGLYHLSNVDYVSWHTFAEAIFNQLKAMNCQLSLHELQPIPSAEYPTPASRPLNSRLNAKKFSRTFDHQIPSWRTRLEDTLNEVIHAA